MKTSAVWLLWVICGWAASSFAAKIPVRIVIPNVGDDKNPNSNFTATLEIVEPNIRIAQIHHMKLAPNEDAPKGAVRLPMALSHQLIETMYRLFERRNEPFTTAPRDERRQRFGFGSFGDDDDFDMGAFDDEFDDEAFSSFSSFRGEDRVGAIRPFRIIPPPAEKEDREELDDEPSIFQIHLNEHHEIDWVTISKTYEKQYANESNSQKILKGKITLSTKTSTHYDSDSDITQLIPWSQYLTNYRARGGETFLVDFASAWQSAKMNFQNLRIPVRAVAEGDDYFDVILQNHLRTAFESLMLTPNEPLPVALPPGITPPPSYLEALREVIGPDVKFGPPTIKVPVFRVFKKHICIPKSDKDFETASHEIAKVRYDQISIPSGDDIRKIRKAYPNITLVSFAATHPSPAGGKELSFIDVVRLGKFMHPDRMRDCGWIVSRVAKKTNEVKGE